MKKDFLLLPLLVAAFAAHAQKTPVIDPKEAQRIETELASDAMRGRRAGTPDIDRAADFIAGEFKKAGLQPVAGAKNYLQTFNMYRPKLTNIKGEMDGEDMDVKNIVVVTTQPELKVDETSGYEVQTIAAGENMGMKARSILQLQKNAVVFVDTSFSKNFGRLSSLKGQMFEMKNSVVFILAANQPKTFKVKAEHQVEAVKFTNVVGMLPGKTRKNEYVVFSGHYDHLGVTKQPQGADSIYNGANDDAAGTTAVIMLANYYKKLGGNERTLVFAAFTAEEIGGFGSQYFSRQYDPAQVMAMFNIEMIGTESKWGRNSAYITGYDKSNMGEILQQNLQGSAFTFYPDPYTKERLFYRSDNATLARLGVPAHTISTAKMEGEPNYHQLSDEVGTLDMENMAAIIRAVAISAQSIVSGKDTPSRVKPESM